MTPEAGRRSRVAEPEVLTEVVLLTFRLNGLFLRQAEELARPAGLTAARWQVLGAVLREPLSVAGVARRMGLARQSVQRVADLLVEAGLANYRSNPAHARAKLLAPSDRGRQAIELLSGDTIRWARAVTDQVGRDDLERMVSTMHRLVDVIDGADAQEPAGHSAARAGRP